jgi:hypothetical protein
MQIENWKFAIANNCQFSIKGPRRGDDPEGAPFQGEPGGKMPDEFAIHFERSLRGRGQRERLSLK